MNKISQIVLDYIMVAIIVVIIAAGFYSLTSYAVPVHTVLMAGASALFASAIITIGFQWLVRRRFNERNADQDQVEDS